MPLPVWPLKQRLGRGAAMVDFAKADDVKRWLDAIEPAERRREVAMALAARAALRGLPQLVRGWLSPKERAEILDSLVLPCLRAAAISWVAAKYRAQSAGLRAIAYAANSATRSAYDFTHTAAVVAEAEGNSVDTRAAFDAAVEVALAARHAALTVASHSDTLAVDTAHAVAHAVASHATAHAAINSDAALIYSGCSGADLAGIPLWSGGAPNWLRDAWRNSKSNMLAALQGWEVWTDWYEARLTGDAADPPNEALEIARVAIPDEIWKQGPAVVNAEIKRLIDEHKKGELVVDGPGTSLGSGADPDRDQAAFAPILATRAALRVLPLLVNDRDRLGDSAKSKYVLAIFRALAVAWARTEYPSAVESRLSIAAAQNVDTYSSGSTSIARHVGGAATESAFASGSADPRVAAHRASRALIQVREAARASARDDATGVIVEQANSNDVSDIVPGVRPDQIAQVELWPGRDPPQFIAEQWEALKDGLRLSNEGWDVWIDWYEARLDGRLRPREVELAYVQFNVPFAATALEANSEIKRLLDLRTPKLPTDPPPIESIPQQERTGTRFAVDAQGRIDVVRIPPTTDELQRFHYGEMRYKAAALAALGQMLGDVALPSNRVLEALPERMEDASVDKLWSRANTLRRRHDAHVRALDNNLGPDPAHLDALVAAHVGDFVDSFNVYVLGDPRALELDSARLGPQDREAARKVAALAAPIARAASELQAPTTPAAQEALTEQVGAAIDAPDDINGDQAAELARKTMGNFVSELLRRAYAPIAKLGAAARTEALFAQKEFRSGFYRASGTGVFAVASAAAYANWPEISAFVVRNADALKDFVTALFHNPRLVEIIDLIVQAAKHLG
jgi:hypothetical protein